MASKVTEGLATFPFSFECLLCRMGFRTKKGFHFWGVFQFTQVQPPPPKPHKQCWTRVSRIFSEFQLCIGSGEGELQENLEKDALF